MTQTPLPEASLIKRYSVKLLSNIAAIPLFFIIEALLPRALGPILYGQYNYALSLFTQIITFFDTGISICMRTSFAKEQHNLAILQYFSRLCAGIFILFTCTVIALTYTSIQPTIFPSIPKYILIPTASLCFCIWLSGCMRAINDSLGVSHISEFVRILLYLFAALVILALFITNGLTINTFLAIQNTLYIILTIGFFIVFMQQWHKRYSPSRKVSLQKLPPTTRQMYRREYIAFCRPLFVIALVTTLAQILERWMLQVFGGSIEQGYFSLAQRIGIASFLFVTAMIPLYMRELSVAYHANSPKEMARLMDAFGPLLYAAAAFLCCFIAIEARAVIALFGGKAFSEALTTVRIMAFYPLHQVYIQLAISVFYATGATDALRPIVVICLLAGVVATWFFLAPEAYFGLSLGAKGLAIKMVGVQVITATVLLIHCKKIMPFSFGKKIFHQIYCPIFFLAIAYAGHVLSGKIEIQTKIFPYIQADVSLYTQETSFLRLFISGGLYILFILVSIFFVPQLIGFSRKKFSQQYRELLKSR